MATTMTMRRLERLVGDAVTWVLRTSIMFALALALARRDALAAEPNAALLMQPPTLEVRTYRDTPTSDLSAGVRVHRGDGRTLDVWLVTPHSVHWDAIAADAPPLDQQLVAVRWPPVLSSRTSQRAPVRFERLQSTVPKTAPLRSLRALRG